MNKKIKLTELHTKLLKENSFLPPVAYFISNMRENTNSKIQNISVVDSPKHKTRKKYVTIPYKLISKIY